MELSLPSSSAASAPPGPMKALEYAPVGPAPLPPDAASQLHEASAAAASSAEAGEAVSLRRLLGETSAPEPLHLRCLPDLSWDDRIMGFLGCFVIGLTVSLTSMFSFVDLIAGNPGPFAWKYSMGNILALFSSAFLVGPRTQVQKMSSPVRLVATLVYLSSVVMTLVASVGLHSDWLTLACIVAQFCALAWYCASYIPFGRTLIKRCVGRYCLPV